MSGHDGPADADEGAVERSEWDALRHSLDDVVAEVRRLGARLPDRREADGPEIADLEEQFADTRTALIRLSTAALAVAIGLWTAWLAAGADTLEAWWVEVLLLALGVVAGVLGSGIAALTSLLDRHARGLELTDGRKSPESDRKDRYSARMDPWFLARPLLGAAAGLSAYGGSEFFELDLSDSPGRAAFVGFLAGLFAKTLFVRLKAVFESIFGG